MSGSDKVCHHIWAMVLIRLSAVRAAAEAKEFTLGGEMRSACLFVSKKRVYP
jgi:hypothetical protein